MRLNNDASNAIQAVFVAAIWTKISYFFIVAPSTADNIWDVVTVIAIIALVAVSLFSLIAFYDTRYREVTP